MHPRQISHPKKVSNSGQKFDNLNIQGFDFIDGFECSDVHEFRKLIDLSINKFEICYHQDRNKWKQKLIPNIINLKKSYRIVDLLIYKNHFVPIKNLHRFLSNHICKFVCGRCLSSYTSQIVLMKNKQQS